MSELLVSIIVLVFLSGVSFGFSLKKSATAFGYSMLGVGTLFALYILHSGNVLSFAQTVETIVIHLFVTEPLVFIVVPIVFVVGLTFGFRVG